MKIALFAITVCVAVRVCSSSPVDPKRQMVNRPKVDEFGARQRRNLPAGVKGHGRRHEVIEPHSLESRVTKGHYVCGDKLCKLPLGVEPAGCNGMCQYPIH